jgi:hypothetical protein
MFHNERCMKLDMIVCRVESGSFELSGLKFLTRANPSYGQVGLDFFLQFSNWVEFWVKNWLALDRSHNRVSLPGRAGHDRVYMNHSVLCNDGKFSISETNDIFFIYLFQYYNYIFSMLLSRPHNQIFVFFLFKFLIFMNAHLTHVSTYSLVPFRAKKTERSS